MCRWAGQNAQADIDSFNILFLPEARAEKFERNYSVFRFFYFALTLILRSSENHINISRLQVPFHSPKKVPALQEEITKYFTRLQALQKLYTCILFSHIQWFLQTPMLSLKHCRQMANSENCTVPTRQ